MTLPGMPPNGPCAPARAEVDQRCAEAARLTAVAESRQQHLGEVRRKLIEASSVRDADASARDRRQINMRKNEARDVYRHSLARASEAAEVQLAAYGWLRALDRTNRAAALADRRATEVARTTGELEQAVPAAELAADAARIAAEAAQASCLEARRQLATCEEDAQRELSGAAGHDAERDVAEPASGPVFDPRAAPRAISLVLRGDREVIESVARRLADETGREAGRVQLLLLELREAISERALEECALGFPASHPFWGQLAADDAQRVATSLAALGYRFDGHAGWLDQRRPAVRDMAIALSHVGLDPRSLRHPPDQGVIDTLWQGSAVRVEGYLAACAPELELDQVVGCLGRRADALSELWDMWGRMRPLLVSLAPSAG